MSGANQVSVGAFVHEALFYRDADEYLTGTLPFITAGLAAGEPVLVAVPGPNGELLRRTLGSDAVTVRFIDMSVAGRNPGRIIPGVLHTFVSEHAPRRARIIGEPIWAGRSTAEYPACVQHEALINVAFATRSAMILCPYDARGLDPDILADAETTHPVMVDRDRRRESVGYVEPDAVVAAFNHPLPPPPVPAETLVFDGAGLSRVRRFVAERARRSGLDESRIADLEISVNEVATNAVTHTGGPGTLRMWQENGTLVCEISDRGQLTNPLVGRIPPALDSENGRGLVLVNYLCDLVRIHTGQTSTTFRLHMHLV